MFLVNQVEKKFASFASLKVIEIVEAKLEGGALTHRVTETRFQCSRSHTLSSYVLGPCSLEFSLKKLCKNVQAVLITPDYTWRIICEMTIHMCIYIVSIRVLNTLDSLIAEAFDCESS